ncbi:MAG: OOP family OmpA-OmpF porin [Oceanicoccus sp.]|jgi:OOP family OmpA-OmpF porin
MKLLTLNTWAATLLALPLICSSGLATAGDDSRLYLNAMIGEQSFDSDRNLDDDTTLSLGGEYRYNDSWASELRYLDTSPDADVGGNVDLTQIYIDGLYYFRGQAEKWQPFVLLGLGHADFDGAGSGSETQANLGGGVRYMLNDNWSLRADARAIHGFDDNDLDSLISIGVSYAFGSSKSAMPAVVVAAIDGDADGDGVADSVDQCPNSAQGVTVNAQGCAAVDSDGDGVNDDQDRCLNTPAGLEVDAEGCILTRDKEVTFDLSLRFAYDSDVVENYDRDAVTKVVTYLRDHDGVSVLIEGHSDSSGSDVYNKALSERRAAAVAKFLSEQNGIDASRLSSVGYGEERPIADNETDAGRAANRRVVAKVRHSTTENMTK